MDGKLTRKPCSCFADKTNSWLRFRYGRLSVDSDDQNFNKKCDIEDDDDDDEDGTECCDQFDTNGNPLSDKNQSEAVNCTECDCVEVKVDSPIESTISETNAGRQKSDSVMEKIMAMTLTDYGELSAVIICQSLPFPLQARKG